MSRQPAAGRGDGTRGGKALALLGVTVLVAVLLLRHVGAPTVVPAGASASPATTVPRSSAATTTVPAVTTTTLPPIPPAQIKVIVLNGTGAGSLAGETTRALAKVGYDMLAPDNTVTTVATSAVYAISPLYVTAGQTLASQLHLPATVVQTPAPATAPIRASERTLFDLVVVIGPGFTVPTAASIAASPAPG